MICPRCGCVFCPEYATGSPLTGSPASVYCSPGCKNRAHKVKQRARKENRAHRQRACAGKFRYRAESDALAMVPLLRLRRELEGDPDPAECRAYGCGYCKGWHLTSKPEDFWLVTPAEGATGG